MRAPLIAFVLTAAGIAVYFFFNQSAGPLQNVGELSAGQSETPVAISDGAAPELFNDICIEGRQSFSETERRTRAAGWARAADSVHPYVARITAISRSANVPGASSIVMHAYAHPQRSQFIVLTDLVVSGRPVNGCYVYDFGATQLPDLGALETSLGAPTERNSEPGIIDSKKWVGPRALPSVATLRAGYFPRGSPIESQLGFTGLLLALTSMSH